jgi:hypothetical protein
MPRKIHHERSWRRVGIELGDLGGDVHLGGFDLDSCLGEHLDELAPWAKAYLDDFPTYTEISPSRRGLKLFFYAAREDIRPLLDRIGVDPDKWGCRRSVLGADAGNHGPAVEVYFALRYFAVTGERWPSSPDKIALLDHRHSTAWHGRSRRHGILRRRRHLAQRHRVSPRCSAAVRRQDIRRDGRGAKPRSRHRRLGASERAIVE